MERHSHCLLFLDMGLGKTVSTLTAVQRLVDHGEVEKTLVVAPKKVAETTWSTESGKWDHLALRVSVVMGTERQRERALDEDADVYVTSRDNVLWLSKRYRKGRHPFDMLVIDELTSFKNPRSQRFKALRSMLPGFLRVVGLTGTPTPNGLKDLWGQVYCIDRGARLGVFVTRFRERWFNVVERNNIVIKMTPKPGAEEEIRGLLADIALTMRGEDYLELPAMVERDVRVRLPEKVLADYRKFEREQVMETVAEAGGEPGLVTAASAAALSMKLSQYANGAVYDEEGEVIPLHSEKLEALGEVYESEDSPLLVFYQYKHDRDRILDKFRAARPRVYESAADLEAWNRGEVRMLLAHPASTAYGLNLQEGGHRICWYSTGWNLEQYEQANARLHRQGQRRPVMVYRLVTEGTIDERMTAAISGKASMQSAFLELLTLGGEIRNKK